LIVEKILLKMGWFSVGESLGCKLEIIFLEFEDNFLLLNIFYYLLIVLVNVFGKLFSRNEKFIY